MNKILSDWKAQEIFTVKAIPESAPTANAYAKNAYVNANVEAANAKADRERYYATLREKAQIKADTFLAKANENPRFKEIVKELAKMEIAQARAEISKPQELPALLEKRKALQAERKTILSTLGIKEEQLVPKYTCAKCSDSGFLPDGTACDCYKK
jgi:hypothetical protein